MSMPSNMTREQRIYYGMRDRCHNKNNKRYCHYGGRGIDLCERWSGRTGFKNFLADMGPCPKGCSIDRIDNDKGYSPENCRWANYATQNRNTSRTRFITLWGEKYCLTDALAIFGLKQSRCTTFNNFAKCHGYADDDEAFYEYISQVIDAKSKGYKAIPRHPSEETRNKMSESAKKRIRTPMTEEQRHNISEAIKKWHANRQVTIAE